MFKYQTELNQISAAGTPCPPASAADIDGPAWRWVTDPVAASCFDPQAVRNPPRLLKAKNANDLVDECSCWGLSMHLTKDASIQAFQALEKSIGKARKIFGGFTAGAMLTPAFGKATVADAHDHFDLHPTTQADFLPYYQNLTAIP